MNKKGYTVSENKFACFWSKKIRLVEDLGGKCSSCGATDIRFMDFHHLMGKDNDINYLLWNASFKRAKEETKKCILLCRNCHQENHYNGGRGSRRKIQLFECLGLQKKCVMCGYYGENLASLDLEFFT